MIANIDSTPRICKQCNVGTDFHKGANCCKTCANARSRVWHSKRENLDKRNKTVNIKQRQRKEDLVKQFGGKCSICGQSFPDCCYDFHHLDMTQKEYNPSYMIKMNPERAKTELSKCILVCSNCHRILHHDR